MFEFNKLLNFKTICTERLKTTSETFKIILPRYTRGTFSANNIIYGRQFCACTLRSKSFGPAPVTFTSNLLLLSYTYERIRIGIAFVWNEFLIENKKTPVIQLHCNRYERRSFVERLIVRVSLCTQCTNNNGFVLGSTTTVIAIIPSIAVIIEVGALISVISILNVMANISARCHPIEIKLEIIIIIIIYLRPTPNK